MLRNHHIAIIFCLDIKYFVILSRMNVHHHWISVRYTANVYFSPSCMKYISWSLVFIILVCNCHRLCPDDWEYSIIVYFHSRCGTHCLCTVLHWLLHSSSVVYIFSSCPFHICFQSTLLNTPCIGIYNLATLHESQQW